MRGLARITIVVDELPGTRAVHDKVISHSNPYLIKPNTSFKALPQQVSIDDWSRRTV